MLGLRYLGCLSLVLATGACDVHELQRDQAGPSGSSPIGKADGAEAVEPGLDVMFASGYRLDAEAHWTPDPRASFQRVTWSLVLQEGDRVVSSQTHATSVEDAGQTSMDRTLSGDFFFDLGEARDSTQGLRSLVLEVEIESCADPGCETATVGPATVLRRSLSFLARPYPDAQLLPCCSGNHLGQTNTEALDDLSAQVERAGCDNVLVTVNGTTYEGAAGSGAAWEFMRDRGYDCLVSVAYNDRDWGWGSRASDDTLKYCESTRLADDALDQVWEAAVVAPGVEQWDMFGHSKGGSAAIQFYRRRGAELRAWPSARVYAIGLPWKLGAQHLPAAEDYRAGEVYAFDQIIAFTWANDAVRNIEQCIDSDALEIGETHGYAGMFDESVAQHPQRATIRDAFMQGKAIWVGDHY